VHLLLTQLGYFKIRSPVSGVLTERLVEPGDLAVNRAHLFTLVQINKLRVRARVSELDLPLLKKGQKARVGLDAYRGRAFEGTLNRIFPSVDPRSRQVVVEVEIDNRDLFLRPGLLARVKFEPLLGRIAINLPIHAVVWDGNTETKRGHVFVVGRLARKKGKRGGSAARNGRPGDGRPGDGEKRSGQVRGAGAAEASEGKKGRRGGGKGRRKRPRLMAVKREVRLGEMVEGRIEILEGLKAGEKVIVSGTGQLKHGKPIRIVRQ
ncbi:MAG: efflux RND transporter periplasmic adaptor subunit, partial [bacterium]